MAGTPRAIEVWTARYNLGRVIPTHILLIHGADPFLLPAMPDHELVLTDVHTFEEAIATAALEIPDLILLDMSTFTRDERAVRAIERLHQRCPNTPIIGTCAACSTDDRIRALQAGVDEFFCQPLTSAEARERIRSKLRRLVRAPSHQSYSGQHLFADFTNLEVRVDGTLVTLTRREYDLLAFLVEHREEVLTRRMILHHVWHAEVIKHPRTIDNHIRRLRRKLGPVARQIETFPGRGYRFSERALLA